MTRHLWLSSLVLTLTVSGFAAGQGEVVEIDGLKSAAPAAWTKGKPASNMQYAVFTLPKAEGDSEDAQLTIFYFGQGGGGDVDSNVKRWQGMFKAPAGEKSKVEKFKVGAVDVTTVNVEGTYLSRFPPFDPNAKVTEKADFHMVGVIFASPKGPYFMRLIGPAKTVEKHKKGFDEWLKNFK